MSPAPMAPVVKAKTLYCPNCGGPVERRGYGYTLTVVCPQCLSVIDASSPVVKILQQIEERQRRQLFIPLGQRGNYEGAVWETIGMQARAVVVDGVGYEWHEYLLFNPWRGFRYLTQYNGHWNWVTPTEAMPIRTPGIRPGAAYEQQIYRHFSSGEAITMFILGEFPWRVKAGDRAKADDFVAPPNILSLETTKDEVTWSKGVYVQGADIWKAFGLPGAPPVPRGVYLNQPSPYQGKVGGMWKHTMLMLLALVVLMIAFSAVSKREQVLAESHAFSSTSQGEASWVSKEFELKGRPATVELTVDTNLNNNWAYFNFALVNEDTNEAYDFGREVSYYYGVDDGESWSEGDSKSSVLLPPVPPGKYYLRVEPEMDDALTGRPNSVNYAITLRHDVPTFLWFMIAGLLLLIPPIIRSIRVAAFEKSRWSESDYVTTSSSSSSSSSDDDD